VQRFPTIYILTYVPGHFNKINIKWTNWHSTTKHTTLISEPFTKIYLIIIFHIIFIHFPLDYVVIVKTKYNIVAGGSEVMLRQFQIPERTNQRKKNIIVENNLVLPIDNKSKIYCHLLDLATTTRLSKYDGRQSTPLLMAISTTTLYSGWRPTVDHHYLV